MIKYLLFFITINLILTQKAFGGEPKYRIKVHTTSNTLRTELTNSGYDVAPFIKDNEIELFLSQEDSKNFQKHLTKSDSFVVEDVSGFLFFITLRTKENSSWIQKFNTNQFNFISNSKRFSNNHKSYRYC
jgi:hypothetical protein